MNQSKINIKYLYAGFIILILFGALSFVKYYLIYKKGIYVVGEIDKVTVGRSGATVNIHYDFNGKRYVGGFMPNYGYDKTIGRKIFIKILPKFPSNYDCTDITVPDCVLTAKSEQAGSKFRTVRNVHFRLQRKKL
jgi:hypothetical protein